MKVACLFMNIRFPDHNHNKAFKRDSQRLAVLVQSLAFVFMEQWFKLGGIALFTP